MQLESRNCWTGVVNSRRLGALRIPQRKRQNVQEFTLDVLDRETGVRNVLNYNKIIVQMTKYTIQKTSKIWQVLHYVQVFLED